MISRIFNLVFQIVGLVLVVYNLQEEIGWIRALLVTAGIWAIFRLAIIADIYLRQRKSEKWMMGCYIAIGISFLIGIIALMASVLR